MKKIKWSERSSLLLDLRVRVFNRYNGHCSYCGCSIELNKFHMDHMRPKKYEIYSDPKRCLIEGRGIDRECNLTPSCPSCNTSKGHRSIEKWRKSLTLRMNDLVNSYGGKLFVRLNQITVNQHEIIFYFEKEKLNTSNG